MRVIYDRIELTERVRKPVWTTRWTVPISKITKLNFSKSATLISHNLRVLFFWNKRKVNSYSLLLSLSLPLKKQILLCKTFLPTTKTSLIIFLFQLFFFARSRSLSSSWEEDEAAAAKTWKVNWKQNIMIWNITSAQVFPFFLLLFVVYKICHCCVQQE